MKVYFLIPFYFLLIPVFNLNGQQKYCADSSIRIKYTAPGDPFVLVLNPDTTGVNIFTGGYYTNNLPATGLMAMKTNWGDSIYWVKKFYSDSGIYINCRNSYKAPDGTLILTGERRYFNSKNFLICRIDTNGNMLWARHLSPITGMANYLMNPNYSPKNIYVGNDAVYFCVQFNIFSIVGKLDLNGNLLWSSGVSTSTGTVIVQGLFEKKGVVYFASVTTSNSPPGNINSGVTITELSDGTGNLIKSNFFKIIPDNYAKSFFPLYLYPYENGSFSLTGNIGISPDPFNPTPQANTRFTIQFDTLLNPLPAYYYTTNVFSDVTFQFDMNAKKEVLYQYNNALGNLEKYFVLTDFTGQLIKSRKFLVTTNNFNDKSGVNIDDKENIHFVYSSVANNQNITEYARLSDLAPTNTLQCFGEDTSTIFQKFALNLINEPYTWPFQVSNPVQCLPVNIYTFNAFMSKEIVCKQVSYCDSMKINGRDTVCITSGNFRYSSFLNPQCFKNINWEIDTTFASLINYEADSAVTLQFKKPGQFYLKANVKNCVVADSMLITITNPQSSLHLNKKDSIICPGSSVTLQVNPSFQSYLWQDGHLLPTYIVTQPGLYSVSAIDYCGNETKDSIYIKYPDTVFTIPTSLSICPDDTAKIFFPSAFYNITWQPVTSGTLNGNSLSFFPQQTTNYFINAQVQPGCNIQKNTTVEILRCPEWVRFSSAFTPNADGLNDYFKPGVSGHLHSYNLKIFNRYGQLLLNSNDPYSGWDGSFNGKKQITGVYVYLCRYSFTNSSEQISKGTLMLIR